MKTHLDANNSCYIHIPFCNKICSYCDFCKIYKDDKFVDKYLDALEKEIKSIYHKEVLDTIYIGGGTPSSLSINQLERLFNILKIFNKSKNIEYTIEGNFDTTSKEKLALYKKVGINRLSFGLESINKNNLKLLERNANQKQVEDTIKFAKEMGFNNINVDLIYALPNETIDILEKDLDFIFSLNIEHISCYSLIIEDHTILKINNIKNISEDLDYEMYNFICNKLKDNNYLHYEISNFSKENYQSKHNSCYWKNNRYYGFGLGASSYVGNKRITNTRSINKYLKENYILDIEELNILDTIEYEVILNLRRKEGINLKEFNNKYHQELKDVYDYEPLINKGLLVLDGNNLYIPEDKWYISNKIIVEILEGEKNG